MRSDKLLQRPPQRGIAIPIQMIDCIFLILALMVFGLAESEIRPEHIVTDLPDGTGDGQETPHEAKRVVVSINRQGIFVKDQPVSPKDLSAQIPAGAVVEFRSQVDRPDDPLQRLIDALSAAKQSQAAQLEIAVDDPGK